MTVPTQERRSRMLGSGEIQVSFEFFPPKTEKMEEGLWSAIRRLEPMRPEFVSVTYGAGGSTRERTHATVSRIVRETMVVPAAHLTCVQATREEVDGVARAYWQAGVRHIVALRGDPPAGPGTRYEPHPNGYANAADLVAGLRRLAKFEISVAAYPEKHPESPSGDADIDNLKAKIDAGATRAITQFFFDNGQYLRFMDRVRAKGITVPIVPGIVPIHGLARADDGRLGYTMKLVRGRTLHVWIVHLARLVSRNVALAALAEAVGASADAATIQPPVTPALPSGPLTASSVRAIATCTILSPPPFQLASSFIAILPLRLMLSKSLSALRRMLPDRVANISSSSLQVAGSSGSSRIDVMVSSCASGSRLTSALPGDCGDAAGNRHTFMR